MKPTQRKKSHNHYSHHLINLIQSPQCNIIILEKILLNLAEYMDEAKAQMIEKESELLDDFVVFL